jgi:hypothetical protein
MLVDVLTEIEIKRPRHEVSEFAADPANATAWYKNIKGSSGRLPAGSRGFQGSDSMPTFSAGRWTTPTRFESSILGAAS